MQGECSPQLTFWKIEKQQVTVDFQGGEIVSDAGLLALRQFERGLGVIAGLAEGWLDPRDPGAITYDAEQVLTQVVYQFLAGYPDCNDANALRHDALFKTLLDLSPSDAEHSLASGSTLARFQSGYTRRQHQLPVQQREVLLEQQEARSGRLRRINDYLVELFLRTRTTPPSYVILDLDPTDDPTHGQQVLSFYHGYYRQHQYFPLLIFDGQSGFPLGAWLRPGTVHASCGAADCLDVVVRKLRQAWPDATILVRGDAGLGVPEMYRYCEEHGLLYAFGYTTNEVLKRRTERLLKTVELAARVWGEDLQAFVAFDDYQAGSWPHPRRVLAKVEANGLGTNRRFVVTNLSGDPRGLYHGFYVKRGDVPEKRIGELKNHLHADRLSAHGFRANGLRLGLHAVAFALLVLFREACATEVPELARAEVGTIRQRLFKVGARVRTSARRIWFHVSASWPFAALFRRVVVALARHVQRLRATARSGPRLPLLLLK